MTLDFFDRIMFHYLVLLHYSMVCFFCPSRSLPVGQEPMLTCLFWMRGAIVQLNRRVYSIIFKMMLRLALGEIYSSISTSSPPVALPFCREFDFGTDASLSII